MSGDEDRGVAEGPEKFDPMGMLDEWARLVEALTGMRQQLLDAGWGKNAAEAIVVTSFVKGMT